MRLKIKHQIFIIAAVSILGFTAYLIFNNSVASQNADELADVVNKHFPILEHVGSNQVRLDKIKEAFNAAVNAGEEEMIEPAVLLHEEFLASLKEIIAIDSSQQRQQDIIELTRLFSDYFIAAKTLAIGFIEGSLDSEQIQSSVTDMSTRLDILAKELEAYHKQSYREFNETINRVNDRSSNALYWGVVIGLLILSLLTVITFLVSRRITRKINATRDILHAVTQGNLTKRISSPGVSRDEMDEIGQHVNDMADNLSENIRNVVLQSDSLFACVKLLVDIKSRLDTDSADTYEIAEKVVQLNSTLAVEIANIKNAVEKAAIDVLSTGLQTLSKNIESIVQSAKGTSDNASSIVDAAQLMTQNITAVNDSLLQVDTSVDIVASNVKAMVVSLGEVRQRCQEASKHAEAASSRTEEAANDFAKLGSSAQEISNIVNLIRNIVSQTNILALNAAVEAANAGQYGKGFSVVASEVKNLAQQTAEAAKLISNMAEEIQADTSRATQTSESTVQMIQKNSLLNKEIERSVEDQNNRVADIARSVEEVREAGKNVSQKAMELAQGSADVAQAAVNAAEKTTDIVNLTSEAFKVTADISEKSDAAREFTRKILASTAKTGAISEVVSDHMGQTFDKISFMRRMAQGLGDAVEVVEGISEKLNAAQSGFDIFSPPMDIRKIKEEHLQWSIKLEELAANDTLPAGSEDKNTQQCSFKQWLADNVANLNDQKDCVAELERAHDAFHRILDAMLEQAYTGKAMAKEDHSALDQSFEQLKTARNLFFLTLDVTYQKWSR